MSEAGHANFNSNITLSNNGTIIQTVDSGGGDYHTITHTGNEIWSWGARSGSGADDYLDVGISGGTRAMSWHENGKVGIGITTPYAILDVYNTSTAAYSASSFNSAPTLGLKMPDNNGGYAGIRFTNATGNFEGFIGFTQSGTSGTAKADLVVQGYNRAATAYQEKLRITDAGYMIVPQTPSFSARLNSNAGLNCESGLDVPYGNHSVPHNIGGHWSTSSYKFTAPVAGSYFFTANLRVDGFSGNYSYLTLQHENTSGGLHAYRARDLSSIGTSYKQHFVSAVVYMAANEKVYVTFQTNGDSTINMDGDSWFHGYLIG
jgi:hypothetical protein